MAITVQPDYKLGSDMAMNIAMNHPQTDAVSFALGRDIKKAAEEDDEKAFLSNIAKKYSSYSINPDTGEKEFKLDRQGMINDAWKYGYADQARRLEKEQEPELKKKIWSELFTRYADPNTGEITDRPAFLKGVHSIGDPEISSKTMEFFQKKDDEKKQAESVGAYIDYKRSVNPDDPDLPVLDTLVASGKLDDAFDIVTKKSLASEKDSFSYAKEKARLLAVRNSFPVGSSEYEKANKEYWDYAASSESYRNSPEGIAAAANRAKTIEEQKTPVLIAREDQMRDARVRTAAAIEAAKNLAPEKLESKETKELINAQDSYRNATNALTLAQDMYFTKYLGKGIKLAYLKQNDPNFTRFLSSLQLALAPYRLANAGTAQTRQEAENIKDIINSDLDYSIDSFNAQIEQFLDNIKNHYDNSVTAYEEQNKNVPKNLKTVVPPKKEEKTSNNKVIQYKSKTGKIITIEPLE